jgi:hypothetical protein
MFPNPWLLIPLILAFIAALSLKEERDEEWAFSIWFPVMATATGGTLVCLYGVLFVVKLSSGPDTGLAGLGVLILASCSLPFLALLYLCLKYRPGPLAYNKRYVLSTLLAVLLLVILVFVLLRFVGVHFRVWV